MDGRHPCGNDHIAVRISNWSIGRDKQRNVQALIYCLSIIGWNDDRNLSMGELEAIMVALRSLPVKMQYRSDDHGEKSVNTK